MGISVSERNCKWDVFSQLYRTRARERACSAPRMANCVLGVFEVLSAPSDLHGIKGADAENREFKGIDELSTPSTYTFSETRRAQLSIDIWVDWVLISS